MPAPAGYTPEAQEGYLRNIPFGNFIYGSSFGPPVAANSGTDPAGSTAFRFSHDFSPFTPPYYDGYSEIELVYKPQQQGNNTLSDIFGNLEVHAFRQVSSGHQWSGGPTYTASIADGRWYTPTYYHDQTVSTQHCMQLTSSLNFLQKVLLKNVSYDPQTGEPISVVDPDNLGSEAWIIQPKMEMPVLDFQSSSITYPLHGSASVSRGMWHQYGQVPDQGRGLFMSIQDLDEIEMVRPSDTGSLADLVGFAKEERKIGRMAPGKTVREAIVAIPFITDINGKKRFYNLNRNQVTYALTGTGLFPGDIKPGKSIEQMVESMQNYVIPPQFNFLDNPSLDPFVMFLFEFEHKFNQQDLQNIWQNLPPESLMKIPDPKTSRVEVGTDLYPDQLFGLGQSNIGNKINLLRDDTRWFIFKVKQKAKYNYYDLTAQTGDDDAYNFNFKFGGEPMGKGAQQPYSYNWPYDYFSMIELAQISSKIVMKPGEELPFATFVEDLEVPETTPPGGNLVPIPKSALVKKPPLDQAKQNKINDIIIPAGAKIKNMGKKEAGMKKKSLGFGKGDTKNEQSPGGGFNP